MRKNDNFDDSKLIFFERVCLLYAHLPTSLPIAFGCASVIFMSLYGIVNSLILLAWYLAAALIFLIRLGLYLFYQKNTYRTQLHNFLFILGTTLTALIWSFAGTLLMPKSHLLQQTIIIVVIAGVVAGGIQSIQASKAASALYVVLSVFPLTMWLLTQKLAPYYLLSAAVFSYMIFTLATSRRGYNLIIATLKLRYENTAINGQLAEINKLLNEELVKRTIYEKSLAQLAEIVNNSKDAIIGLNANGNIYSWNKGAESLYKYTAAEAINKNLSLITPESQWDLLSSMIEKVKNNSSYQDIELERQDKNKNKILVSATLSSIKNVEGTIIGISTIDRDIRERKELDRVKNEFISVVSHELRTPLTSIKGAITILLHKKKLTTEETSQRLLEIASHNCERLIQMVNEILDIEKIESGRMRFHFQRINLLAILQTAVQQITPYADKYDIKLHLLNPGVAFVNADADRLLQVMDNLLSNAIKFSNPNSVVEISMEKQDKTITVAVIDHGIGIPEEFHSKLFLRFSQADASTTRNAAGTGLGLSICKAILNKHDIELKYKTKLNEGTTFYFQIPLSENNNSLPEIKQKFSF